MVPGGMNWVSKHDPMMGFGALPAKGGVVFPE